jgi:protein-L-isoaspartate(D-aspartate) O-methyltransferase
MLERSVALRAFYARYVTLAGGAADARVEAAFASVPRENFVGDGPWFLPGGLNADAPFANGYFETPDQDVAFIYQDVLVALDPFRGINNGQPSLHARCMDALGVQPGETALHIGAGTGYYTAVLAQLVGGQGRVHAYEIDPALAARAAENLEPICHAGVAPASGTAADLPKADVIYVNAGITQPSWAWLDALNQGGRLLFPLQPEGGFGAMLLVTKPQAGGLVWPARFVCRAGFIAMEGRQDALLGKALTKGFLGQWRQVRSLHLDGNPDETAWVTGGDWWLSTRAVSD